MDVGDEGLHFSYNIVVFLFVCGFIDVLILFEASVSLPDDSFDLRKFASFLLDTHLGPVGRVC